MYKRAKNKLKLLYKNTWTKRSHKLLLKKNTESLAKMLE